MKLGITGHQDRPGIDWPWTRAAAGRLLDTLPGPIVAFSSLAAGTDQEMARLVLDRGGRHVAVIPFADYARAFSDAAHRSAYLALRARSEIIELCHPGPAEQAYLAAGRAVVDRAEILLTIWDGHPARGIGGTADVVAYARAASTPVIHLDPIDKRICNMPSDAAPR